MPFVLWFLVFSFLGFSCSPQIGLRPDQTVRAAYFLPDDIPGWKRAGPLWEANNHEELYQRINGGATIFIKYGFHSYAEQIYHNQEGIEVEVSIYLLDTKEKVHKLFNDQLIVSRTSKKLENLGEEARVDESGLFHNLIEFIYDRFFIKVIIQDKSKSSLQIARRFGQNILQKINKNM